MQIDVLGNDPIDQWLRSKSSLYRNWREEQIVKALKDAWKQEHPEHELTTEEIQMIEVAAKTWPN